MTAGALYLPSEPARNTLQYPLRRCWHFDMAHAQFGGRIDVQWIARSVDHAPEIEQLSPYRTQVCEVVKAGLQPSLAGACTPQHLSKRVRRYFGLCHSGPVVPSKQPGATDAREARLRYGSGLLSLVADRHSPRSPLAG